MTPAIHRYAQRALRRFGAEARADAVQEVLACSLVAYVKLYERGRVHLAFPSVLVRYAVAQYRCGRHVGTPGNSRDLFSPLASRRRGVYVNELDQNGNAVDWRDVVVEDRFSTPADIAAFRIDFAAWLKSLPRRQRGISRLLAAGETASVTARRFHVSDGRISQIWRELERSWREFHSESAVRRGNRGRSLSDARLPHGSVAVAFHAGPPPVRGRHPVSRLEVGPAFVHKLVLPPP